MAINTLGYSYFSDANSIKYWSVSQFKNFLKCEAKAMAELRGDIPRYQSDALIIGNYLHTYFDGKEEHESFLEQHEADIYSISSLKRDDVIEGYDNVLNLATKAGVITNDEKDTLNGYVDKAVLKTTWDVSKELGKIKKSIEGDEGLSEKADLVCDFIEGNKELLHIPKRIKKAGFVQADKMIETLKNDELASKFLEGETEVDLTGEIKGVPFKAKVDVLDVFASRFVDIKTTAHMGKKFYDKQLKRYVPFLFEFGYHIQMYVYQQLIAQNYGEVMTPYIVAVSKEDTPNKEIYEFDDMTLLYGQQIVERHITRLAMVKNGDVEPRGCGNCEWCKRTKKLETPKLVSMLLEEV